MSYRIVSLLLIIILFVGVTALGENEYLGTYVVSNCEEWVSLREVPSTKALVVTQIPLGAYVTTYGYNHMFYECFYQDYHGYILCDYLLPFDESSWSGTTAIENEQKAMEGLDYINQQLGNVLQYKDTRYSVYIDGDWVVTAKIIGIPDSELSITWSGFDVCGMKDSIDYGFISDIYCVAAEFFYGFSNDAARIFYDELYDQFSELIMTSSEERISVDAYSPIGRYMSC